ncbi:type VII secretion-associated serine protease [Micromonospora sp. KC723]|nr:type VII secretion-associated serine protease [Micromonospora sp. KC723]
MTSSTLSINPSLGSYHPSGADRIRNDQWHLKFLNITEAHKISQGLGVVVAIPDTGVAPHPDLENNLLAGTDIIPGGNGDGRRDINSHGTSMAGIVAAHGQPNSRGALGIAPKAKVLPIYSSPPHGEGSPENLAAAIDYAVSREVGIISVSSAGGSTPELVRSVRRAIASDIVVVSGAGNLPRDRSVGYPASETGVIAVSGLDRFGHRATISTTGPEVDIAAPAVDIFSTSYDAKYSRATGTSDATAIVAGAAALIRSRYPHLPAAEVAHRLTATAVDKGPPGRDDEYGYGVIDIVAALTADVPPLGFESSAVTPPSTDSPAVGAPEAGDDGSTARGLVTLGVLVAAGGGYWVWRRRRRADDPPPRISR